MAEAFMERKEEEKAVLPRIERRQSGPHTALDVLANASSNLRTHSEGTYRSPAEAAHAARVAANVQAHLPEGSPPVAVRLQRLLASV